MNPFAWALSKVSPSEKVELLAPTGATPLYRQVAVSQLFDWMAGVPDPDVVLARTGRSRADLQELLRDAEVSQAIDTRRDAVIATPWRLEPYQSRAQKFMWDEIAAHMPALVYSMWQAVPYGYSVTEPIFSRRPDGRIGIARISMPPFYWFKPMQDGTLRYFPDSGANGTHGVECDPRRLILAQRSATLLNPYGDALLSVLYWPVNWRLQGWQLWLNFLETFGSPIVVGKTGSYNAFIEAMVAQGVTRAVGWQSTNDSDSITTITASAPGEFERLENALNKTIQKVVLGQTLTSDVGTVGSFAAAKVHNDVRDDKRRADLRIVTAGVQHVVDALWYWNRFPGPSPIFVMEDGTGLETERADRDVKLFSLGWRPTRDYLVNRYDLEDKDFTLASENPQPVPQGPPVAVNQAANTTRFTPQQQAIENAIARVPLSGPLTLAQIRSVVVGAQDDADLEARLALLVDEQDPEYADLLARAQFIANVIGYVHATETPSIP